MRYTAPVLILVLVAGGLWLVPLDRWVAVLNASDPSWLVWASLSVVVIQSTEAARLVCLSTLPVGMWRSVAKITCAAGAISLLPSGWFGGDAYRGHAASKMGLGLSGAVSAVLLSRVIGLFATLGLTGIAALLLAPGHGGVGLTLGLEGAVGVLAIGGSLAVVAAASFMLLRKTTLARQFQQFLRNTVLAVTATPRHRLVMAVVLGLGTAIARAALLWVAAKSVGTSLNLDVALLIGGLALIVTIVPVVGTTVGVREAVVAGLLAGFGVDAPSAISISVLARLVTALTCVTAWGALAAAERVWPPQIAGKP
ncbi:lysylphosphatidylglycerol synthase domain-containing protein [Maricaulis sp.]|uniref:lysylphosphatidylglycerol synthase domain-containing protein n=1 Tax=Maricaulis sp. TaxID=1486257 RepID=UPI002B2663B9|nr:lysylphosphatidylglycerol synthase domain-containing protein [Maricaulis sp.]